MEGKKMTDITDEKKSRRPTPLQPTDVVAAPAHYSQYKIEPITFIMGNKLPFWLGNVIKYTMRAGAKHYDGKTSLQSEITDLNKAKRYIDMRLNELKGRPINEHK